MAGAGEAGLAGAFETRAGPGRVDGMTRPDGRAADALRPVRFSRRWLDHAEGSVLVEFGKTRVLCAASVTEEVPRWRRGSGLGWEPTAICEETQFQNWAKIKKEERQTEKRDQLGGSVAAGQQIGKGGWRKKRENEGA